MPLGMLSPSPSLSPSLSSFKEGDRSRDGQPVISHTFALVITSSSSSSRKWAGAGHRARNKEINRLHLGPREEHQLNAHKLEPTSMTFLAKEEEEDEEIRTSGRSWFNYV